MRRKVMEIEGKFYIAEYHLQSSLESVLSKSTFGWEPIDKILYKTKKEALEVIAKNGSFSTSTPTLMSLQTLNEPNY